MKEILQNCIAVLGISLPLLILLEVSSATLLKLGRAARDVPFMLKYTDEEIRQLYSTQDVQLYRETLEEQWLQKGPRFSFEPFVQYRFSEYEGKYVTVSALGYRHVKNQATAFPSPDSTNIFVFGGSTTFGIGVRDGETVPSCLQEILNERYGMNVSVYNFGVSSYYSTSERIRFAKLLSEGYTPGVAVFIDGLNDFYYVDVPDRTAFDDRFKAAFATTSAGTRLRSLASASYSVELISKIIRKMSGEVNGTRQGAGKKAIQRAAQRLSSNREMLRGICRQFGIALVLVQQPVPTYHYDNAQRVVPANQERLREHLASAEGYEYMVRQARDERISNDSMLWLQDLAIEEHQYVDTVHYSPMFSRTIAEQIAKYIIDNDMIESRSE